MFLNQRTKPMCLLMLNAELHILGLPIIHVLSAPAFVIVLYPLICWYSWIQNTCAMFTLPSLCFKFLGNSSSDYYVNSLDRVIFYWNERRWYPVLYTVSILIWVHVYLTVYHITDYLHIRMSLDFIRNGGI